MATCREISHLPDRFRGGEGTTQAVSLTAISGFFFNISHYYQSNVTNLMWPLNTGGDDTDENDKDDDDDDEM